MTRTYAPLLAPFGLTYPQYLVLVVLLEGDGRSVKEIGSRLHLDSGTLTPLLKRLEAAGYVERRRGVEDEREVRVFLSAAGRKLHERIDAVQLEIFCKSALTMPALTKLREQLQRLRSQLLSD